MVAASFEPDDQPSYGLVHNSRPLCVTCWSGMRGWLGLIGKAGGDGNILGGVSP